MPKASPESVTVSAFEAALSALHAQLSSISSSQSAIHASLSALSTRLDRIEQAETPPPVEPPPVEPPPVEPLPPSDGDVITVKAGGDFQAALNAAKPGDEIVLDAGAVFTGAFTLPAKADGPLIVVRSSATLPNRRISPADAPLLASIGSPNVEPAILGHNTANWKFDGIQLLPTHEGMYNAVWLEHARNVTFDRILFIGGEHGQRRVILGNGQQITVTRSHFENVFRKGDESNAFCCYNGAGPYTLTDNYFEVAGINILIGGANQDSEAHIPSDILVEGNHLTKRLEWKPGGANVATVKNLFEIKCGRRITVRGNLMEHNWTSAQNGYGVLFTCSNDGEKSPWTIIEDILFEQNTLRHVEHGFNISGHDYHYAGASRQLNRVTIQNNDIEDCGQLLMVGNFAGELAFINNRASNRGGIFLYPGAYKDLATGQWVTWTHAIETLTYYGNVLQNDTVTGDVVGNAPGVAFAALVGRLITTPEGTNE